MGKKANAKKANQEEIKKVASEIAGMKVDKLSEAKKLIEEQNKKDAELCQKEVQAVLEKYGCNIMPTANVVIDGRAVGVMIIKK